MNDVPLNDADRQAYLKAQKTRNLYIGLGLLAFVALVFVISMVRMSQGLKHDHEARAAAMSSLSASASH